MELLCQRHYQVVPGNIYAGTFHDVVVYCILSDESETTVASKHRRDRRSAEYVHKPAIAIFGAGLLSGALYASQHSSAKVDGNITFANNTATIDGGEENAFRHWVRCP